MHKLIAVLLALSLAGAAEAASHSPAKAKGKAKASGSAKLADGDPPKPDRPWSEDVLYFVLVDRFADGDPTNDEKVRLGPAAKGYFHGGDLKGLLAHLDEISSLGVTAIWINPVIQQIPAYVQGAGFPDWAYHGYWADDYDKIDPRFGTEEDLHKFVNECHRRGIKVLLDVVYNHVGYDSQYVSNPETRGWLRSPAHQGCGDDGDDLTQCLSGLPDWMTEKPEVAEWLLKKQLQWAQRIPFDGFRLDTIKHVDHAFWKLHRKRTRELFGPKFFLLGELWAGWLETLNSDWFAPDEIDAGFDFTFPGNVQGWVTGRMRGVAFDAYLRGREKVVPGHMAGLYLSSHDVPGFLYQLKGDKQLFKLAVTLQMTAPGLPIIYYGEEVGRIGGDWPDNRSDFPWGDQKIMPGAGVERDEDMRAYYQKLISIHRAHAGLMHGKHKGLVLNDDLLVFQKTEPMEGDAVVVALNRGAAATDVTFTAPQEWMGAPIVDLLMGGSAQVKDGKVTVTLPARGARIFGIPWKKKVASTHYSR
jgi:alpha-amylase